ncbi:hypothetical protein L1987_32935 [Smallanthus sonchifolius]|uniref:Uncharacterized protein n=1 Tax=Smallanthus sonchifolius TaxID=185202 RepID=A0ACB9HPL5_9ASTR|nr:hypothetical protein L1987_32935 [Smallanthus sonchifolius]
MPNSGSYIKYIPNSYIQGLPPNVRTLVKFVAPETIDLAVKKCAVMYDEVATQEPPKIDHKIKPEDIVYKFKPGNSKFPRRGGFNSNPDRTTQGTKCQTCQKFGHSATKCPNVKCFNCREIGHYRTSCPKPLIPKMGGQNKGIGRIADIPVVCDHPDIFPEELPEPQQESPEDKESSSEHVLVEICQSDIVSAKRNTLSQKVLILYRTVNMDLSEVAKIRHRNMSSTPPRSPKAPGHKAPILSSPEPKRRRTSSSDYSVDQGKRAAHNQ